MISLSLFSFINLRLLDDVLDEELDEVVEVDEDFLFTLLPH